VLVSAMDGRYHRVHLPGLNVFAYMIEHRMMALSPDGTKLAYAWNAAVPETDNPRVPSGVAVVDLMTGDVRRYARPGGRGVEAGCVSWSPNGRFLTYALTNRKVWDGSSADGEMRIERLDLRDGAATVIAFPRADGSPAVSDDGRVGVVGFDFAWTWDPDRRPQLTRVEVGQPMGTVAWSPDGARIAIGSDDLNEDAPIVVVDPRDDSRRNVDRPGLNQVAAWLDDSRIAVLHADPQAVGAESETDVPDRSLQVVDVDHGTVRTRLPLGQASDEYTFATALLQRPSRDFPEPDWPPNWSAIATTAIKIGLALLLASSVAGSLLQRRRKRDP
jgi:WD40-like Beta Propeller Repeat